MNLLNEVSGFIIIVFFKNTPSLNMQEDFREQVEDWEEFQELTVSQRERLLASPDFPQRLLAQLRNSSAYQEAYWEAVSEVAAALLTEISRQPDTDK